MELSFSFPFFPPKSRDTIHTLARLAPGRKYIPHTGYAHHSFWGLPPPSVDFRATVSPKRNTRRMI